MKRLLISLSLAMMLVAVMATPAMAATDSGTTDITGTVVATIDITVPGAQDLGNMSAGVATELGSPVAVTGNCNKDGWTLGVKDARSLAGWQIAGHMDNGTDTPLTNALQVKGGDQVGYAALSATDVMLEDGGDSTAGAINIADINFSQTVDWTDPVDSYTITVTFTGTVAD